jgi:hypothetical protein
MGHGLIKWKCKQPNSYGVVKIAVQFVKFVWVTLVWESGVLSVHENLQAHIFWRTINPYYYNELNMASFLHEVRK